MAMLIMLLSIVVSVGSLICWIMVLIKMFPAEGAVKGILAIICVLYALVWGWMNKDKYGLDMIVKVWTGLIVVSIILNILARAVAH